VSGKVVDDDVNRRFFFAAVATRRSGRQPNLEYAGQRLRRKIQAHDRTGPRHHPHIAVDNFDRIVRLDGTDGIVAAPPT